MSGFFLGVTRRKSGSGHSLYLLGATPKKRVPKKDAAPTPYAKPFILKKNNHFVAHIIFYSTFVE